MASFTKEEFENLDDGVIQSIERKVDEVQYSIKRLEDGRISVTSSDTTKVIFYDNGYAAWRDDFSSIYTIDNESEDADEKPEGFSDDEEKMKDFYSLPKAEFLASYSYLTEEEYNTTLKKLIHLNITNSLFKEALEQLSDECLGKIKIEIDKNDAEGRENYYFQFFKDARDEVNAILTELMQRDKLEPFPEYYQMNDDMFSMLTTFIDNKIGYDYKTHEFNKIQKNETKKEEIGLNDLNSMLRNFNKEVLNALKSNCKHDDILQIESKYIAEYGPSFKNYCMFDCSKESFDKMASIIKLHNTENIQKFEIGTYYNIFGREWKANGFGIDKENNDMFFGGEERNGTGGGFSLSSIAKADFKETENSDVNSNFEEVQKSLQAEIIDKIFKTGEPDVFLRDYLLTASKDALNYLCEEYLEFEDYKNEPFDVIYERLENAIYKNGEMNIVIENIINDIEETDELHTLAKEFNIEPSFNSIPINEDMDVEKEKASLDQRVNQSSLSQDYN